MYLQMGYDSPRIMCDRSDSVCIHFSHSESLIRSTFQILLLDEATSALDTRSVAEVQEALDRILVSPS